MLTHAYLASKIGANTADRGRTTICQKCNKILTTSGKFGNGSTSIETQRPKSDVEPSQTTEHRLGTVRRNARQGSCPYSWDANGLGHIPQFHQRVPHLSGLLE